MFDTPPTHEWFMVRGGNIFSFLIRLIVWGFEISVFRCDRQIWSSTLICELHFSYLISSGFPSDAPIHLPLLFPFHLYLPPPLLQPATRGQNKASTRHNRGFHAGEYRRVQNFNGYNFRGRHRMIVIAEVLGARRRRLVLREPLYDTLSDSSFHPEFWLLHDFGLMTAAEKLEPEFQTDISLTPPPPNRHCRNITQSIPLPLGWDFRNITGEIQAGVFLVSVSPRHLPFSASLVQEKHSERKRRGRV